jgi:hypothetical protein
VSYEKTEFAKFFQASWEPCLRAVIASTLIVAGAPLSCTTMPDHGRHPDDGPSGQS